ncbi:hypothetical protein ACFVY1_48670 [Streptomyces sp. NPDC058293]|uniref:hypothetical protein n=1 Tax=Streptomyces sp. NPDC058293 TaxID=3346429 RepID=UPI0036EA55CA
MALLTRDKVVDSWFGDAEAAVQAARAVVETAQQELAEAERRLERVRVAREVAAEADAVLRERAGEAPAEPVVPVRNEPLAVWRPQADPAILPREYPRIVEIVRAAGPGGIRSVEVHRQLGLPDTDSDRQGVRNRLQRLSQKGWLRLVSRGVYAWAGQD